MHFNKLHSFLNKYRWFAPRHSGIEAPLPYRIVTICRTSEAAHVMALAQQLLTAYDVTYRGNEPAVQAHLTSITVELMCSVSERAGLVQLVTRLGREVGVRSVRWESIPKRSAHAAPAGRHVQARAALSS
ncbi:hypothetical protein [Paraherbaspirillum soli]|uniref:MgtC-like C-terminal domain-containing protein n=1 Tax=Paraherbaspirillum soli TaxID=631222 RepID=A0ABW0M5J3_9BURK